MAALSAIRTRSPFSSRASVASLQAAYYVPTGIWPLLHMRSFEWITGPKADTWLVKTVAAMIVASGGAIGLAARTNRVTPEIELLGIGTALSLAAVDVIYVSRGRIRPIYLLDAVANLGLIAGYLVARSTESATDVGARADE